MRIYLLFGIFLVVVCCRAQDTINSYTSENLKIEKLDENTFVHISYLDTKNYGKVPCNGMIVISAGEAIIIDTPVNDNVSKELINWIENSLECKTIGVVASHFHVDCLGGLAEFHRRKIPSYASNITINLAKLDDTIVPQQGFDDQLELKVGTTKLVNHFIGEGHTKGNIVSYFPKDRVLFGGCLIKGNGAGKGNLEDANTTAWPKTVAKVKTNYGNAKIIIPGHGKAGGLNLLDYTIKLFEN